MSTPCNQCTGACFAAEEECLIREGCPRDEQDPCYQKCATDKNFCLLDDCVAQGLCCDEICTPNQQRDPQPCRPPDFNPPQTPCQQCKTMIWEGWGDCMAGCENENCMIGCTYNATEGELDCLADGQCCDDNCCLPEGGYNRAMRGYAGKHVNGLGRGYAGAGRGPAVRRPMYAPVAGLNLNARVAGRGLNAPYGRAINAPVFGNPDRMNPLYERQLQNPRMGFYERY
jgi:hypothetical protein